MKWLRVERPNPKFGSKYTRILMVFTENRPFVYVKLRDDDLTHSLKFDWLITTYDQRSAYTNRPVSTWIEAYGTSSDGSCNTVPPELFRPSSWSNPSCCTLRCENNEYDAPTTASSCVTAIKQIGVMLTAEYIKWDGQPVQDRKNNVSLRIFWPWWTLTFIVWSTKLWSKIKAKWNV